MPDNNQESFEDASPVVDIQQLEEQLHLQSEEDEEENQLQKCDLWANWCIFIVPGRIRQADNKPQSDEDSEQQDEDRFIPKTKIGRQIGVMHFIYYEKARVFINAMLCIDVVLHRIRSFSPQMVGIDRYDDLGVLQWRQELRRFVDDYFSLSPAKRRKVLNSLDDVTTFSPEMFRTVARLEYFIDIPNSKIKTRKSERDQQVRVWPDGLAGRDLELFKLLSGMETISPRNQALSVLNFILPKEAFPKQNASVSPDSSVSNQNIDLIRFEPGDRERIARLIKRFPSLKKRYPYLLFMIENEIPIPEFNVDEGKGEYIYSHVLPTRFHFPSVLAVPSKKSAAQSWNWFSNRFDIWYIIIAAALFFLIKIVGILIKTWI